MIFVALRLSVFFVDLNTDSLCIVDVEFNSGLFIFVFVPLQLFHSLHSYCNILVICYQTYLWISPFVVSDFVERDMYFVFAYPICYSSPFLCVRTRLMFCQSAEDYAEGQGTQI